MGLLDELLSGGQQQQQDYRDFVNRYEQGHPSEGYSDEEVYDRYRQVAPNLPNDVYQESAQEAFARLSPQERMQFGEYLEQRARQQGVPFPGLGPGGSERYQDPGILGQVLGGLQQQQPDLLGQILGGGGRGGQGSILDNPLAKAAMAGVVAMAAKKMMGRAF
jgi:hypothetical protein